MRWVVYVLVGLGAWLVLSVITAPLVGWWLARHVDGDEFGFDLVAPPPDPTFTAAVEHRILFDWAKAEQDLADRSNP